MIVKEVVSLNGWWFIKSVSLVLPSAVPIGIYFGHIIDLARKLSGTSGVLVFSKVQENKEVHIMKNIPPKENVCLIWVEDMDCFDLKHFKSCIMQEEPQYKFWNIYREGNFIVLEFTKP